MNIRLPLYDIFGYLLPGIVAILAAILLTWSIYLPNSPLTFLTVPKQVWLVLIVLAYFAGHIVQAIGNAISDVCVRPEERTFGESADLSCKELVKEVRILLHKNLGVNGIEPIWIYRICDAAMLQCGITNEREVYVYREGFYRGASVAFGLLTLAFLVRGLVGTGSLLWDKAVVLIPGSLVWLLFAASACACALMLYRFYRFALYRVRYALVSYLLIDKKIKAMEAKGA